MRKARLEYTPTRARLRRAPDIKVKSGTPGLDADEAGAILPARDGPAGICSEREDVTVVLTRKRGGGGGPRRGSR